MAWCDEYLGGVCRGELYPAAGALDLNGDLRCAAVPLQVPCHHGRCIGSQCDPTDGCGFSFQKGKGIDMIGAVVTPIRRKS